MSDQGIKIVFGGASIGTQYEGEEVIKGLLDKLVSLNVSTIDTAQLYGESEALLGQCGAGERFTLDTKAPGGFDPGSGTEEAIVEKGLESLKKLKVDQVDVFYLHAPDSSVPIASTLAGINTLHKRGVFRRFGLSNYKASDVRAVHEHCSAHSYILPTVYQGNYSPVARLQEKVLFPTLRELGIAFYAYSPLAGGFLSKTKEQIQGGEGRFDNESQIGKMYYGMYAKPAYLEALAAWAKVAEEANCDKAELAYRWVTYNCVLKKEFGDAIVIGGRNVQQVEQTLGWLKHGALDEKACEGIEQVWKKIEHEAPLDNYHK